MGMRWFRRAGDVEAIGLVEAPSVEPQPKYGTLRLVAKTNALGESHWAIERYQASSRPLHVNGYWTEYYEAEYDKEGRETERDYSSFIFDSYETALEKFEALCLDRKRHTIVNTTVVKEGC